MVVFFLKSHFMEIVVLIALVLDFIIANAGARRRIGFGWALFLGLLLSPIVSLIAVVLSEKIIPDEDGDIEKNWGCKGPIIVVAIIVVGWFIIFMISDGI